MQGIIGRVAANVALAALVALCLSVGSTPAGRAEPAPRLLDLRVSNGSTPFAGDRRLLTTVSPNGDGFRDRAIVTFRLLQAATVQMDVLRTVNVRRGTAAVQTILTKSVTLEAGRHHFVWTPVRTLAEGTYVLRLSVTDMQGRQRVYDDSPNGSRVAVAAPVVRIQGIDVASSPSYAPGQTASVSIATDARFLRFDVLSFRRGLTGAQDPRTTARPIAAPTNLLWTNHRSAPAALTFRIGNWPSGLYFIRITARDGRVGYAPFVVRPRRLGTSRIAVIVSTNTWQAYNFDDANGDGWGDTWYDRAAVRSVDVRRPYVDFGIPFRFRGLDAPIFSWLAARPEKLDFLTDVDLAPVNIGELARDYDLIVFPGHEEYVTGHEYDLVERYRDEGGNLMFLSANNLFWKVVFHGAIMRRVGEWRNLGRPEAAVIGVQYVASDYGTHQAPYVVADTAAQWLFAGTGLRNGDAFGHYGYEIDVRTAASPPGTILLASAPDLMGPGRSAEMTYYETPDGAKVFAAGALNFAASVSGPVVERMLENVWSLLSRP